MHFSGTEQMDATHVCVCEYSYAIQSQTDKANAGGREHNVLKNWFSRGLCLLQRVLIPVAAGPVPQRRESAVAVD